MSHASCNSEGMGLLRMQKHMGCTAALSKSTERQESAARSGTRPEGRKLARSRACYLVDSAML